ncbi:glycoside hydrolase [Xanthomonas bonasiae]|uniref:glycoside hydrolase n=1 Tax=Xanthomonas bonasiae TaxID=2810351 RepID=UPI00197F805E|nr:glycoside hydrolase [Xanthomonas bonasiae]MBN6112270.1 glycosyl hydrolase [Xanthomonas bonasiae]
MRSAALHRPRTSRTWPALLRRRWLGGIVVAALALPCLGAPLCDADAPVTVALRPDLQSPRTRFEGFGTALAWFANVTGAYPDPVRNRLADLLYGRDGLGWVIARYNIGGGNAADTPPYLRPGAAIPGFWRQPAGASGKDWWRADDPAMWDWSADQGQRWWLDAIRARVPADLRIFEAFSNSPPWFMTVSGRVSGAERGLDDNLRPGQDAAFATYLARVVEELQRRHGIAFRTLSPVNEPDTPYWFAGNTQEGAHWSVPAQERILQASDRALRARGLQTRVAAMDETSALGFIRNWSGYSEATKAVLGQLNVHSYDSTGQTGVRDIAAASGIRLWMSENDLSPPNVAEGVDDMRPALALAEHMVLDLKRLQPSAWVFWQAIETSAAGKPGSGRHWGLIRMDLSAAAAAEHPFQVTRKYWAMANFSRYLRPGMRLLPVDDPDTVAALSADGRELVFVHVNAGLSARRLAIAPQALGAGAWSQQVIVTSASQRAETGCRRAAAPGAQAALAPPQSVVSVVLRKP